MRKPSERRRSRLIGSVTLILLVSALLLIRQTDLLEDLDLWQTLLVDGKPKNGEVQLVLYELYYSEEAWEHLHNEPPYRGICVHPNMVRKSWYLDVDVDATKLLPPLRDLTYQGLLCEYGAMFTLDSNLKRIHGRVPYLGFQSWRAEQKGIDLKPAAIQSLISHMRGEGEGEGEGGTLDTRVFYFWSTFGIKEVYQTCDYWHVTCSHVYSAAFHALFGTQGRLQEGTNVSHLYEAWNPPMPLAQREYSYCSYWIMHVDLFREFMVFARAFFVTLEALWKLHEDVDRCPLNNEKSLYNNRLCWCFIMERVVNIWVYHSGTKMMWIDGKTGSMEEQNPVKERENWLFRFGDNETTRILKEFKHRIGGESLKLYHSLGGKL